MWHVNRARRRIASMTPTNVLLTGRPGCGKTTVIRRVIERLGSQRSAGFYTQEIRQAGHRVGFEAVGLGGDSAMLAHVDFRFDRRVGRYGVESITPGANIFLAEALTFCMPISSVELDGFESLVRKELGGPCPGTRS